MRTVTTVINEPTSLFYKTDLYDNISLNSINRINLVRLGEKKEIERKNKRQRQQITDNNSGWHNFWFSAETRALVYVSEKRIENAIRQIKQTKCIYGTYVEFHGIVEVMQYRYTRERVSAKQKRATTTIIITMFVRIWIAFIDSGKCGIRSARLNL